MRNDPYFRDISRKILDMRGEPVEFPVLYYDFRFINAIFTARTTELRKLLPHANFKTIDIRPGIGMLGIAAFEYHDTSIGPYNEIAIVIPVSFPPRFAMPGLSAISMMLRNVFSVYVHHLPVTTEIALKSGVHFWNYPKFLAEITFHDQDENLEVILKEGDDLILKMLATKLPLKKSSRLEFHTYSIRENVVMHALVEGQAPRLGTVMMGSIADLELGVHRISKELTELNLNKPARSGLYAEGVMAKLHEPDQRWKVDTIDLILD